MPESAPPPTAHEIADVVRRRIRGGELSPGDRLPSERDLADAFGVGRVRVRDALAQLADEGYLEVRRGATGGRFVTGLQQPYRRWVGTLSPDEADDIVDFRIAVESETARLAAQRRTRNDLTAIRRALRLLASADTPSSYRLADAAFHTAVAAAARSPRLGEAVERARGDLFGPVGELFHDDRAAASLRDHTAIADAIAARDADRAAGEIRSHIEATRAEVHQLVDMPAPHHR